MVTFNFFNLSKDNLRESIIMTDAERGTVEIAVESVRGGQSDGYLIRDVVEELKDRGFMATTVFVEDITF